MSKTLLTTSAIALVCNTAAPSVTALASAASLAPRPTTAQGPRAQARMRFDNMDQNRDGEVSREEWRGSPRSFVVHDWNGDGRLSGEEVRVGGQRQDQDVLEADHGPSQSERYMSWTDRGFANLDHDRNRRITANEWHYDRETFARADRNRDGSLDRAEFVGGDVDDDRGDQFEDLDVDGDGRVERGEWHASEDAYTWLDRNRDGSLSRVEVLGADATPSTSDQFASLDMNRDQRLARDEWHWSAGSFAQRDLNRDGWLTRREFAATSSDGAEPVGRPATVTVDARQRWTDSTLDVRAGDVLAISARGSIVMSGDANDTATPAGSRTGRGAQQAPVNAVAGALIGRIDDGPPFLIGDKPTLSAPATGRLYFSVNDDHLQDNRGQYEVTTGVQSGHPPRRE